MMKSALEYHTGTSYDRHEMGGHYLDWQNQPLVFKTYPGIEPLILPSDIQLPEGDLSSILNVQAHEPDRPLFSELTQLAGILLLTNGITAKARHGAGEFHFRSAASAGALYPTEIYVATHGINSLDDGLYHFSPVHNGLTLLRKGDLSAHVAALVRAESAMTPVLTFFLTAIFFRSAWKYRTRSYRYHLLDTGHVAENLILALRSERLSAALSYDFDDHGVNHLLGLDETREVCLAMCHVPGPASPGEDVTEALPELPEEIKEASRVAEKETDYPALRAIHKAGVKVISQPESKPGMIHELGLVADKWSGINPPDPWPETLNYAEAVFHRRSKRNFVKQPISQGYLTALLDGLCAGCFEPDREMPYQYQSICTGFLAGNAEGFDPGLYLLDTSCSSIGMVDPGSFMDRMTHICLDQAWLANAAVHFLFMANPGTLDRLYGARGYRYAMLTAGRLGERLYLMATAMGLGCCGIGAFYDMEAAELLGLSSTSRLLYLVAVGPVK